MLIDAHSHLNFADYDNDRDEVIKRSLKANIWLVNVGSNYYTSSKAVELAERYEEGVYAAVGLHPIHIKKGSKENVLEDGFDYHKYKKIAQSKKVVAVGEIGLDYWDKPKTKKKLGLFKQKQKEIFLKQLELARELNLPVILHCRLAHRDLISILQNLQKRKKNDIKAVVHCFTGTWQEAQSYLKMGLYLGFNGIIFKLDLNEIIKKTPLERILTETDCPFLTPPQAKTEKNEPIYIKYIIQRIAEIKKQSPEKIAEITAKNAGRLFKFSL